MNARRNLKWALLLCALLVSSAVAGDRFDASVTFAQQQTLSNVMGRLQAGSTFALTTQEFTDLSNLAGALNYWAAKAPAPAVNVHDAIPRGDFSRKTWQASTGVVDVFPFLHPGPPFANGTGVYYMSVAEFQGDPWLRKLCVSKTSGDANCTNAGKQATAYVNPGDYPIGTQLYANILLLENAPPGKAGSGFSIVWP